MATNDFVVKNGLVVTDAADILSANDAASSSDTTASLYTAGGIAIAKKAFVGGTLGVTGDVTLSGDLAVNGGDITSTATTFNLLNSTVTTGNLFGAGTAVNIGAATGTTNVKNNLQVDLDVDIRGGDLTTNQTTFNLLNTTATTVNAFGAGTTVNIGNASGAQTISIGNASTGASTYNFGTSPTATATTKTVNIGTGGAAGSTTNVVIGSSIGGSTTVNSGTILGALTTQNVFNTVATTVNAFGAGTTIGLGATTGTLTINNPTVVGSQTTVNLWNTTTTTVNFAGAGTTVNIGATTGTTTVKNNLQVDIDLEVRGGDITTNQTTFNLVNGTATTVNFAGAGTAVNIGAATGTTNVKNNLDVDGDVNIDGGDLTVSTSTFNLVNTTASTVNFAGAGTAVNIGAATGTTTVKNNLDVDGDVNIDGGDLTVSTSTFNLANANATTVNFAGAGTAVNVGATSGTTTVRNNLQVNGNTTLGDASTDTVTFTSNNLSVPNALTITIDDATAASVSSPITLAHTTSGTPANGMATGLQFVAETSNNNNEVGMRIEAIATDVTLNAEDFDFVVRLMDNGASIAERFRVSNVGNATLPGDIAVNGGDVTTVASTASVFDANALTVSAFSAATTLNIGNATSSQTITIGGSSASASTYNFASAPMQNGVTKTINLGTGGVSGSTSNINIGSTAGLGTITTNEIIRSGLPGGAEGIDFATNDVYASFRVIRNAGTSNQDGMYIGYQNTGSASTKLYGGGSGTVSLTINSNSVNSTSTTTGSAVVNGGLGVANRTSAGAFYSSSGESQVILKDATAGTYLGVGIADGTSGWSLGTNCIGIKMDSTTYSAMGMAGSNGILYWARTLTTNGTMNSFLEVDNTRKFYLPTNISSTSTTTGSLVVNGGTGIVGALYTGSGITNASGSVIRQRYDGSDNYLAELGWQHLQLGNNGANYIIGGRTNTGGSLVFVTNQTNSGSSGALPTINGTTCLTLASGGTATFGTSSAVNISIDTSDALDFTANSTNDDRGISFNGRAAVTADFNDGYLRLNNSSEFGNGVYIPNFLGIGAGANTSYRFTVGSATDAKMVLSGSNSPYIRWQEGSTDRFYIQWSQGLTAPYYDNQASNYHYFNGTGASSGLILRTSGTNRGYLYCNTSNEIGLLDEGGSWAIRHVNDSMTQFRDADEVMFEIGVGASVLGDYGTVTTAGNGKNSWEGYSINGRCVFMHDGSNGWGIYDDTNNQWLIYGEGFGTNRYVDLRYNGAVRLTTNSAGVDVTGLLTATTKSFLIDHPTKEGMKLQYACLEGPENGVYVRGKLDGESVIELPDYWLGLVHSDSITVNLTANGAGQQLYVDRIEDNRVYVVNETGKPVKCFYTVYGERKDVDRLVVETK